MNNFYESKIMKNMDKYWNEVERRGPYYAEARVRIQPNKVYELHEETLNEVINELKDIFQDSERKPLKLLDVGCFDGQHSIFFAEKGFSVTGIDYSEVIIKKAKEKYKSKVNNNLSVNFFCHDIKRHKKCLSNDGNFDKYDIIFLHKFVHQWRPSELEKLKEIIINLLAKQGVIVICTMHKEHGMYGKGIEIEQDVYQSREYRPAHYFDIDSLKKKFLKDIPVLYHQIKEEKKRKWNGVEYEVKYLWIIAQLEN